MTLAAACASAQDISPLPQAHAHNDYLHERPLLDALEQGFCSVEADIFLVENELRIGHFRYQLAPGKTLEKLYLEPLLKRAQENSGSVYKGSDAEFTLLIDIKTEGKETFERLHQTLMKFKSLLSGVQDGSYTRRAVTVIISGNRAAEQIESTSPRFCGIDGRLSDLDSPNPAHLMPLISDNWRKHFSWQGEGPMPNEQRERLRKIVATAHDSGRRVRFWATPESEELWSELRSAGVDLLNTDDLPRMRQFLERAN